MKKKILFARVIPEYALAGFVLPPLGPLYLASNLNDDRYSCIFFDAAWSKPGNAEHDFRKKLSQIRPDIIAIHALTPAHAMMVRFAEISRQSLPETIVICGGPHVSVFGKKLLNKNIDFLMKGEGEFAFSQLCRILADKEDYSAVPGIIYEKDGTIIENKQAQFIENLDTIRYPAWDMINFRKYRKFHGFSHIYSKKPIVPLMSSRACPFSCTYCHRLFGQGYKTRSSDDVIGEIEMLYNKYGIREIQFVDDVFNLNIDRATEILDRIVSMKMDLALSFPNGLVPRGDKKFLKLLKKAGTYYISYAPESASERVRKFIKKSSNLSEIKEAIAKTVETGIFTNGYFMIGFPTETKEEVEQTIRFAVNSRLHTAAFFTVVPFPNTELAEIAGIKETEIENMHYFNQVSYDEKISDHELLVLKKKAYRSFYMSPLRAARIIAALPSRYLYGAGTLDIAENLIRKLIFGHH